LWGAPSRRDRPNAAARACLTADAGYSPALASAPARIDDGVRMRFPMRSIDLGFLQTPEETYAAECARVANLDRYVAAATARGRS